VPTYFPWQIRTNKLQTIIVMKVFQKVQNKITASKKWWTNLFSITTYCLTCSYLFSRLVTLPVLALEIHSLTLVWTLWMAFALVGAACIITLRLWSLLKMCVDHWFTTFVPWRTTRWLKYWTISLLRMSSNCSKLWQLKKVLQ